MLEAILNYSFEHKLFLWSWVPGIRLKIDIKDYECRHLPCLEDVEVGEQCLQKVYGKMDPSNCTVASVAWDSTLSICNPDKDTDHRSMKVCMLYSSRIVLNEEIPL